MAESDCQAESDAVHDQDNLCKTNEILSRKRSGTIFAEDEHGGEFHASKKSFNDVSSTSEPKSVYWSPSCCNIKNRKSPPLDETIPYYYEDTPPSSVNKTVENLTVTPTPHPLTSKRLESKKVRFKNVDVFFFPRSQSFDTVPSKGGAALGMEGKHNDIKRLSVTEYEAGINSKQIMDFEKTTLTGAECSSSSKEFSHEINGSHGDKVCRGSLETPTDTNFIVDVDDDNIREQSFGEYNFNFDSTAFYKCPLDEKARRRLLRASGVRVDKNDRVNCNFIRSSRETCGCSCVNGICIPSICECIKEEICCQNERPYFPCQCTVNSCKNPFGFVEFNPDRVRSHQTSVFFRLNNFPDSFEVSTPKHVYLEDSRVRSTYLPLTPTTDDKSLSVEPLIDKKLKSGNDALGASHNSSTSTGSPVFNNT